jgi:hypothetical protein
MHNIAIFVVKTLNLRDFQRFTDYRFGVYESQGMPYLWDSSKIRG